MKKKIIRIAESDIRDMVMESVNAIIMESQDDFSNLYALDDGTDILEYVRKYLSWSKMGETNPMFSIQALKLHDALMDTLSLSHDDVSDRRTFAKILGYVSSIDKEIGILSIRFDNYSWIIEHTDLSNDDDNFVYLEASDFEGDKLDHAHEYVIAFRTWDGVDCLDYENRESTDGISSGIYTTDARMTQKMRQKIYEMGLVPALNVNGSYHENFIQSVGVIPKFLSQAKKIPTLYFDCEYHSSKSPK